MMGMNDEWETRLYQGTPNQVYPSNWEICESLQTMSNGQWMQFPHILEMTHFLVQQTM
jgi:hypothetical protein